MPRKWQKQMLPRSCNVSTRPPAFTGGIRWETKRRRRSASDGMQSRLKSYCPQILAWIILSHPNDAPLAHRAHPQAICLKRRLLNQAQTQAWLTCKMRNEPQAIATRVPTTTSSTLRNQTENSSQSITKQPALQKMLPVYLTKVLLLRAAEVIPHPHISPLSFHLIHEQTQPPGCTLWEPANAATKRKANTTTTKPLPSSPALSKSQNAGPPCLLEGHPHAYILGKT